MESILEILGSIGFDWRVALANFVNFLIVLYLLNRFIFRKLRKTIRSRTDKIARGMADAQAAKDALKNAEEEKNKILGNAHVQAHEIMVQASHRGNELITAAEEQGVVRGEEIIERAQQDIMRREKESMRVLNKKTVDLIVSGVEKILRLEIEEGRNEEFVSRSIQS